MTTTIHTMQHHDSLLVLEITPDTSGMQKAVLTVANLTQAADDPVDADYCGDVAAKYEQMHPATASPHEVMNAICDHVGVILPNMDAIGIDRSTVRRAGEIYWDWFGSKWMTSAAVHSAILRCKTWTELFDLQCDDLISVGECDALEAAIREQ